MSSYDGSLPPDDGRWWYWNTSQHAWALSAHQDPDNDPHPTTRDGKPRRTGHALEQP